MENQPWLKYQNPQAGGGGIPSSPWMKYQRSRPADPPEEKPTDSPITAAMTGLAKGAVPFVSHIAGAGKAGMDAITGVRGPLAGGSLDDIADDYHQTKDAFNREADQAYEANPGTSMIAQGAPLAATALMGVKKGADLAIDKLANSEKLSAIVKNYILGNGKAVGGAIGKTVGSVGGGLGGEVGKKVGEKAGGTIDRFAEKFLARQAGVAPEATRVAESVAPEVLQEAIKKGKYDPFLKRFVE